MQLNQVTVAITDIERSIIFYEKLGLKLIVKDDHYARFIAPGNEATFSIHKTDSFHPSETIIYFETDEIDEKIEELRAAGIVIEEEPVMQSWLWYESYINDPDGNSICIYHAGENRLNPPWRIKE
jgi:catechol 2,3-dioxygenase-like lactoylglutathione lyase family enzyme